MTMRRYGVPARPDRFSDIPEGIAAYFPMESTRKFRWMGDMPWPWEWKGEANHGRMVHTEGWMFIQRSEARMDHWVLVYPSGSRRMLRRVRVPFSHVDLEDWPRNLMTAWRLAHAIIREYRESHGQKGTPE